MVGILPNDASVIRLIEALLFDRNDEWLLGCGDLSAELISLLLEEESGAIRKEMETPESHVKFPMSGEVQLRHFMRFD